MGAAFWILISVSAVMLLAIPIVYLVSKKYSRIILNKSEEEKYKLVVRGNLAMLITSIVCLVASMAFMAVFIIGIAKHNNSLLYLGVGMFVCMLYFTTMSFCIRRRNLKQMKKGIMPI